MVYPFILTTWLRLKCILLHFPGSEFAGGGCAGSPGPEAGRVAVRSPGSLSFPPRLQHGASLALGWAACLCRADELCRDQRRESEQIHANLSPLIRKSLRAPIPLIVGQKLHLPKWNLPYKVKTNKQKLKKFLLKIPLWSPILTSKSQLPGCE